MNDNFLSFLGIIRKSGNLFFGIETVKKYIENGRICFVLASNDISENALKKIKNISCQNKIKFVFLKNYSSQDLNISTGIFSKIFGISNESLAKKLCCILNENSNNFNQEELYDKKI